MRVLAALVLMFTASIYAADLEISGVRPELAAFNKEGECGIGAVVPWAGQLWWITYPPHFRHGSPDKLYSIDDKFNFTIHPESVGGTDANRLIHRESNQLFIGPYAISADGKIRVFDVKKALPGRLTATARHPLDPANKVIFVDMEGPVWEADVKTLETKKLFEKPLPGWHGKGAYTSQGRLVVANNGESPAFGDMDKKQITADLKAHGPEDAGVLGEWDGKEWRVIERRQFTDVTGPGGIHGNEKDTDPIWAMGWDKRSVMLKLLDGGKWFTFRLPKASYAFDPKHGWYTEWPRIREIGGGKYLAVMHGTMFDFPKTFSAANTSGIKPIATHLRYIPDFTDWNGKLVLAEDSTSAMQNPMAGQSQSNLWFGSLDEVKKWGPAQGWGGPWLGDAVKAGTNSDPFLFAGYARRMAHLTHNAKTPVTFTFETDTNGTWKEIGTVTVPPTGYVAHVFPTETAGDFIRVRTDKDCPAASCYFHYSAAAWSGDAERATLFASLTPADSIVASSVGIVRPGKQNRNLQFLAKVNGKDEYYEVDEKLTFKKSEDQALIDEVKKVATVDTAIVTEDAASLIVIDHTGARLRLPKSPAQTPKDAQPARAVRELMSERFMANIGNTFYEIPRAEGTVPEFRQMKAVSSHTYAIKDFCTWRGLLVISGTKPDAIADGHYFSAGAGAPGLWFGVTDDIWKFGKPVGMGGPWKDSDVKRGDTSDAYLMTNFDKKTLNLNHDCPEPVEFKVEIDYSNREYWKTYATLTVKPGETLQHVFPEGFSAHWVRLVVSRACKATAQFKYE